MRDPILHSQLPHLPWLDPRTARLPGIQPITDGDWLHVDEVFAAQMAERDRLIRSIPDLVHACPEVAHPAASELYDLVLEKLRATAGYRIGTNTALRPDGVEVTLNRDAPLLTLGHLVQEDLCLMQRQNDEHALTAAILCFPAGWTLAEKLRQSLARIHLPVTVYSDDLARRVQRLFDAIRPEQPLWRMNYHIYADPTLFQPRAEADRPPVKRSGAYVRSERQCLLRLPKTDAVLFSIHTYQAPLRSLAAEPLAALQQMGVLHTS